MIKRDILEKLRFLGKFNPVISIIGPRQVGKTTLALQYGKEIEKTVVHLDLEKSSDFNKLSNAELFLNHLHDKCVIIDEVQLKPEIFSVLRPLIDVHPVPLRFILLGSANPNIVKGISESLTGRVSYLELNPLNIKEISRHISQEEFHFRGGYPKVVLMKNHEEIKKWLDDYILGYTARDLPLLGLKLTPEKTKKLWEMLAWLNGNLLNLSSIGKSMGLSYHTISDYLDYFEGAFLIKRLPPFYKSSKKRLVRSPKIYLRDTGILHRLLHINDYEQLLGYSSSGYSFESMALNQILNFLPQNFHLTFYRTQSGSEVDFVIEKGIKIAATVEIKFSDTPKMSKNYYTAITELNSSNNFIVLPSGDDYVYEKNIRVCSIFTFVTKYMQEL